MSDIPFVVNDADFVFFDTEMTGLDLRHELIEIGFVKVKAKTYEVLVEKNIRIKPTRLQDANPQALEIVGYSDEEWKDGVDLKTGLEQFLEHTKDTVLVGHNLPFDWMQLKKSLESVGLETNYFYKGLDTFSLAWQKLSGEPNFQKFSLAELSDFFGIDPGQKHRALDDAKTTYQVFMKLKDM